MQKIRKKKRIFLPAVAVVLLLTATFWYVNDYYHSDENVWEYFNSEGLVSVREIQNGVYLDGPGEDTAMIFYPGAKVEYTAYLPLFGKLAEQGIDAFLLKMPCNLAFLGKNRAEEIINSYDYAHWYLSGHSLGGAMAASYASEHLETLDGLALLAAYPTKNLQAESFAVVSIYGSEDGVLNMEKVEAGTAFMPSDYTEVRIEGEIMPSLEIMDCKKAIRRLGLDGEEQQEQAVTAILGMIKNRSGDIVK